MSFCVFKAWIKINLVNNNDNCYHITSVVYDNRQLMFYWFSNHNRSVYSSEYAEIDMPCMGYAFVYFR